MRESRDRKEQAMIQLLDTALGFVAIMAMLSLLVKCLTSLIKNYVDYYSGNLHAEVDSLVQGMLGQSLGALAATHTWLNEINWKSLGEEYLTVDKMKVFLQQLEPGWVDMGDLQSRVDLHVANLRYDFERKMKNLALAAGLAVCLLCNVNSVTIWKTLYTDQQLRTTFAKEYSEKALRLADDAATAASSTKATSKEDIEKQAQAFRGSMETFLADVSFGVGRVWRGNPPMGGSAFLYEFLGSLLTGILVSIGAPYWHDLLRTLSNLRKSGT
jgi:hypothetical protein